VTLEFWFELASTYSYLSAMRIETLVPPSTLQYRPFLLGPIFQMRYGTADSPFNRDEARGRYMWRDVERRCDKYGLPFRRPSVFPRSALLAARVALLLEQEPAEGPFVRAIFRANFAQDRDISQPEVVREVLHELQLPTELLERAQEGPTKERLKGRTSEAVARGIFGAPNFFVGTEMFWGDDRLEDARVTLARARGVAPT
jgi:2-hydroxychromene-2-carboxylate isomerase